MSEDRVIATERSEQHRLSTVDRAEGDPGARAGAAAGRPTATDER